MKKAGSIWTYNFSVLFITNCVMYFSQTMVTSLLPKYLYSMDYGSEIIGVVIGMFSITALCTRPVTGPLIDGKNKKTLFLTMIGLLAVTSFGYAFSKTIPLIIIFRLTHGIGLGFNAALVMTMAADALPEGKLALGMGTFGMSSILAMAFGPGIGLFIAESVSYRLAFCISGVLILITLIIASRMRIESDPNKRVTFTANKIFAKECAAPALFLLLFSLARVAIMTYIIIYITDVRKIEGISVYFFINAAALLAFQPLMGRISDRWGLHVTLITSCVFFTGALLLLAFCSNTWQLWLVAVFNALGFGVGQTQLQALAIKITTPDRRGVASTTAYFGNDIGDLLGPVLGGFIIAKWNYETMFVLAVIPVILCAVIMMIWLRRRPDPRNGGALPSGTP